MKAWFDKIRYKLARLIAADLIDDLEYRLSAFLYEQTGGYLSKSNYTLEAMISAANDARERDCEECTYYVYANRSAKWRNGYCTNCKYKADVLNIGFNCCGDRAIIHYKTTNFCPGCGAEMSIGE